MRSNFNIIYEKKKLLTCNTNQVLPAMNMRCAASGYKQQNNQDMKILSRSAGLAITRRDRRDIREKRTKRVIANSWRSVASRANVVMLAPSGLILFIYYVSKLTKYKIVPKMSFHVGYKGPN